MYAIIAKLKLCFLLLLFPALILILLTFGCEKKDEKISAVENKPDKSVAVSNKPLAGFQNKLLDTAFEAATSIPVKPHIKERSKTQEDVVSTCLKLNQPERAIRYTEKIENWRRNYCYADVAFYCAQHDDINQAERLLNLAGKIPQDTEEWRNDRVNVKIAQTQALLGHKKQAEDLEKDVTDSQKGKVAVVGSMTCKEDSFDEQIKTIDGLIASGKFDIIVNAQEAYAQLFNRFYTDEKKRLLVEEKIKSSWEHMPFFTRIELLMNLAEFALNHSDQTKATELVNQSQELLDTVQRWDPELRISMTTKLIGLEFRAGNKEKAIGDMNAMRELYNTERRLIINVFRAGVLRNIAQAYQAMGDTQTALSIYKQAIEEGFENPNSRPRAEDLSATCCSMALNAVEPDAELWTRIQQIKNGLGDPW